MTDDWWLMTLKTQLLLFLLFFSFFSFFSLTDMSWPYVLQQMYLYISHVVAKCIHWLMHILKLSNSGRTCWHRKLLWSASKRYGEKIFQCSTILSPIQYNLVWNIFLSSKEFFFFVLRTLKRQSGVLEYYKRVSHSLTMCLLLLSDSYYATHHKSQIHDVFTLFFILRCL